MYLLDVQTSFFFFFTRERSEKTMKSYEHVTLKLDAVRKAIPLKQSNQKQNLIEKPLKYL